MQKGPDQHGADHRRDSLPEAQQLLKRARPPELGGIRLSRRLRSPISTYQHLIDEKLARIAPRNPRRAFRVAPILVGKLIWVTFSSAPPALPLNHVDPFKSAFAPSWTSRSNRPHAAMSLKSGWKTHVPSLYALRGAPQYMP